MRAAIAAYVLWGFLTVYWKQLADFDPFELIGWRILCATVVLAAIITLRRRWPVLLAALRNRRTVTRLAVAAVLLTANWTAYVWAVTNDRIIETALGYFMAPLGTMILGVTVLHEHASRLQKLAIGLAALAVVVLTVSYGRPPVVALVLAATWSTYGLLKRQVPLSPVESLAGETFLLTIPAGVLVLAMSGASRQHPVDGVRRRLGARRCSRASSPPCPSCSSPSPPAAVPFTLLGALQYLVPTINFLLGWLVYDEPLPLDRLVGFALVWAALVAVAADQMSTAPRRVDEHRLSPTVGS